jgi:hypothetical protein
MRTTPLSRTLLMIGMTLALGLGGATTHAESNAAAVTCKDGSTSAAKRGACSHHGGIAKAGETAPPKKAAPAAEAPAAPAPASASNAATVTCKDGTTSAAGRGACSHHGGIAKAGETAPPKKAAPARAEAPAAPAPASAAPKDTTGKNTDPTGATAKCKDGTFSHSPRHTGTCSHHGGVGEWLDGSGK